MILLLIVNVLGSLASIAGLCVTFYVLRKGRLIQQDVTTLKNEEEAWHKKGK